MASRRVLGWRDSADHARGRAGMAVAGERAMRAGGAGEGGCGLRSEVEELHAVGDDGRVGGGCEGGEEQHGGEARGDDAGWFHDVFWGGVIQAIAVVVEVAGATRP